MSTDYTLDKPTTKTELLNRLAKYGIDEKPPGCLHIHYNADEKGPDEDGHLFYYTDDNGMVRDLRRTYRCGRVADILDTISHEFGEIHSEYDEDDSDQAQCSSMRPR